MPSSIEKKSLACSAGCAGTTALGHATLMDAGQHDVAALSVRVPMRAAELAAKRAANSDLANAIKNVPDLGDVRRALQRGADRNSAQVTLAISKLEHGAKVQLEKLFKMYDMISAPGRGRGGRSRTTS